MLEQSNSSILSKVSSETALAVIPFFFTLIVFMYQVGKFFFYDIPLQHISISLGELFSFWFGFFIVVGIIGWTLVTITVGIVQKSEPKGFFRVVLLYPLAYSLIHFLIFFPIAPFNVSVILAAAIGVFYIFGDLALAWSNENKQFTFWERILSNHAKNKYERKVKNLAPIGWWDKLNDSYVLGFFCIYVVLGFPCKIGYLLESNTTRHWVDATNNELLLIQTQNEFHLLKEYDQKERALKPGYVIRPVADSTLKYIELETGEIKKLNQKAVLVQGK